MFYYHQHCGLLLAGYTGIKLLSATDNFGALYAVPLFFLISGYCIHLSNIKYIKDKQPLPIASYYKKRLLRIYPAYLVAIVFSLVVNFIVTPNYPFNWHDVLIHVFLLQGFTILYFNSINVVLWTITIEMAFYILYPLFYYLRLRFSLTYAIAFALIISAISIDYFSLDNNFSFPKYYFVFNIWFAWCCGAYIADKKMLNAADLKRPLYKIFYGAVFLLFIWGVYKPANSIIGYQANILIWTAPLLYLINKESWLTQKQGLIINLLVAIGLSSYSLYLFHDPLIYLKNFVVHTYLPKSFQSIGLIVGIFLIPVITWFSYLYIEKPFMVKKPIVINE